MYGLESRETGGREIWEANRGVRVGVDDGLSNGSGGGRRGPSGLPEVTRAVLDH